MIRQEDSLETALAAGAPEPQSDAIQRAIRYAGTQVFLDAEDFRKIVVGALGI